ncbi:MAG: 2-C-methyl-D-erythritol 2,4-cyclodiphosphate synthase [Planctomycetota bacterium]
MTQSAQDSPPPIPPLRIGLGYDTHRLDPGGPLRLGGVDIPAQVHAVGHSDADALLHAITDAILGAIGAGDIGCLFPDDAAENKDRDSADFLRQAVQQMRDSGFQLVNLDSVVLCQWPKLSPHWGAIRQRVADLMQVETDRIGVKAKTGENVGPVGEGRAIRVRCVALLCETGRIG